MGFVNPSSRARLIQSHTKGCRAFPDNPPPPYFSRGDILLPQTFFQSRPFQPKCIVLETQIASQLGLSFSSIIALIGADAMLYFGIKGTPSAPATSSTLVDSSINSLRLCPVLGQEKLICNPNGAEKLSLQNPIISTIILISSNRL